MITRQEIRVAIYDLRRRLRGFCNDAPWAMGPTSRGGYSHWRCQLRRGHTSLHRYNNYTWGDDPGTRTIHDPVPVRIVSPGRWREPEVPGFSRTRRQRVQSDRFMAERLRTSSDSGSGS